MQNLINGPRPVTKYREADQHGDGCGRELRQNGHRQRRTLPTHAQPGLDFLLEDINVVLEFPGEEFADLCIKAIDVGEESEQAKEGKNRARDGVAHRLLLGADWLFRSINPTGRRNCRRSRSSLRAIRPLSRSWSYPAKCRTP